MRNITESFFTTCPTGWDNKERITNVPFFKHVKHAYVRAFTRGYGAMQKGRAAPIVHVFTEDYEARRSRATGYPIGRDTRLLARGITCLLFYPSDPVRDVDRIWSGNIVATDCWSLFELVTHSQSESRFLGEAQETQSVLKIY